MLQPNIESAPYSELNFPQFNPQGFVRVREAIEFAQQTKALARTPEEMREATAALRAAGDIKNAEQQIARANFEEERQRAFGALSSAFERAKRARLSPARRLEVENRLDHLVTLFNMKDFAAVRSESVRIPGAAELRPPRPLPGRFVPERGRNHTSGISALFRRGLALERAGRIREAVEVYGRIIARHPHHPQAIDRLKQIGSGAADKTENRRTLCMDRYTRRAR